MAVFGPVGFPVVALRFRRDVPAGILEANGAKQKARQCSSGGLFLDRVMRLSQPVNFSRPRQRALLAVRLGSIWCRSSGIGLCSVGRKRPVLLLGRTGC